MYVAPHSDADGVFRSQISSGTPHRRLPNRWTVHGCLSCLVTLAGAT